MSGHPEFTDPAPIARSHDLSRFTNGRAPALDMWLRERARSSEGLSARTYVVCTANDPTRVVGYYAISAGSARVGDLPSAKLRRSMPEPFPAVLLGRLAVDAAFVGAGVGSGLVNDALGRVRQVARIIGVRALFVRAIDDEAAAFYSRRGFTQSPSDAGLLLIPVERIAGQPSL